MPLKINKGGPLRNAKHDQIATGKQTIKHDENPTVKHVKFLTEDQAEFICKRVNTRRGINTKPVQQEMNSENLIETNTYKKAILAEVNKKKDPTQIEEWLALSDHVRYVTHGESEAFHKLNIDLMN